jgi:hypothetical protein
LRNPWVEDAQGDLVSGVTLRLYEDTERGRAQLDEEFAGFEQAGQMMEHMASELGDYAMQEVDVGERGLLQTIGDDEFATHMLLFQRCTALVTVMPFTEQADPVQLATDYARHIDARLQDAICE